MIPGRRLVLNNECCWIIVWMFNIRAFAARVIGCWHPSSVLCPSAREATTTHGPDRILCFWWQTIIMKRTKVFFFQPFGTKEWARLLFVASFVIFTEQYVWYDPDREDIRRRAPPVCCLSLPVSLCVLCGAVCCGHEMSYRVAVIWSVKLLGRNSYFGWWKILGRHDESTSGIVTSLF